MSKPRNGGQWTEARYRGFIRSALRKAWTRWGPNHEAKRAARIERGVYLCAGHGRDPHPTTASVKVDGKRKNNVFTDHIEPIGTHRTWDETIERMFCEAENLQVLCLECHSKKSSAERLLNAESKSLRAKHPREEGTYRNMMSRCFNPNATGYEYYGGRGITVCDSWRSSFMNFFRDMGERPEGTTLDRIDVNGSYCPENCRWATHVEQARNTTANHMINLNGEALCLREWGERLDIKPNTILARIRRGWTAEQALEMADSPGSCYTGRLTQEDIEYILASDKTQVELGEELGIHHSQISRVSTRFGRKRKGND